MKHLWIVAVVLAFPVAALLSWQGSIPNALLLPLWGGKTYSYYALGPAFKITGNTIDVPAPVPTMPTFAPDDAFSLSAPQAAFTLRCSRASVYRNGVLQFAGIDYTVDATGKIATFAPNVPQATDTVQIIYRCQQGS